ncbi:translin-like [Oscarella lobularis]|uniref:translin-like n=1 Tax=Oscarella lobularis TaxID=121494 RepID=UPI0033136807
MAAQSETGLFFACQDYFVQEQDVREEIRKSVRELDQTGREILNGLQSIHKTSSVDIPSLCAKSREKFAAVREQYADLKHKVPQNEYYRFHDHWRNVTQRLTFLAALLIYLEKETLATREDLGALLGVEVSPSNGFHVDLEDFLMGLLTLASELTRLAVNSVTAGDYGRPVKISAFLAELNDGFRLLNLKNDALRKRFDGLKYDIKKVEEVIYDITIRGLKS